MSESECQSQPGEVWGSGEVNDCEAVEAAVPMDLAEASITKRVKVEEWSSDEEDPHRPGPSHRPPKKPRVAWEEGVALPLPIKVEPGEAPEVLPPLPNQLPGFSPASFYTLHRGVPVQFKGGNVSRTNFSIQLNQSIGQKITQVFPRLLAILSHAYHNIIRRSDPSLYGQIIIANPQLNCNGGKMYTRIYPIHKLPILQVLDIIEAVLQSDKDDEGNSFRLEDTVFQLVTFPPQVAQG
jgi:hypothetical protein